MYRPSGIPEQVPLGAGDPRSVDLRPDLVDPVRHGEGQVLDPGYEERIAPAQGELEAAKRSRDGRRRAPLLGSCEPELARAEQRRIGHRVDRVEIRRHPPRNLARCRGHAPQTTRRPRRRHARRTGASRLLRVAQERRDGLALAERAAIPVDGVADGAVRGEADVVEHDLVEPRTGGGDGDVDVVLPDAPVVRVRPAETGRVAPDASVRMADREVRSAAGEQRVLERHDAPDEVDARAAVPRGRRRAGRSSRGRRRSRVARGTPEGSNPTSPFSSFTSSSSAVRPSRWRSK